MADHSFGVVVALHDRCLNCGCSTAYVGWRRLLCDGCECSRGHVSPELRTFLEKFVQQFGRPDQPIILRSGKLHKPAQPGDEAANATATKPKRKAKMKMNDLFPSKYLRAADLQGKPRIVTIDHVTHEIFKDDGVSVTKTIVHFRGSGTAPVVLNKTNWRMLESITGVDDDEGWDGTVIELRSEKVQSKGGKIVDSIRIHEVSQPASEVSPKPKKAKALPEFNDEIPL